MTACWRYNALVAAVRVEIVESMVGLVAAELMLPDRMVIVFGVPRAALAAM